MNEAFQICAEEKNGERMRRAVEWVEALTRIAETKGVPCTAYLHEVMDEAELPRSWAGKKRSPYLFYANNRLCQVKVVRQISSGARQTLGSFFRIEYAE